MSKIRLAFRIFWNIHTQPEMCYEMLRSEVNPASNSRSALRHARGFPPEDAFGLRFVIQGLTFAPPVRCLAWDSNPAMRASSPEYLETANMSDKIPLTALSWTDSDSALSAILHIRLAAQPECPASTPTA
jgi:hypothetical protein